MIVYVQIHIIMTMLVLIVRTVYLNAQPVTQIQVALLAKEIEKVQIVHVQTVLMTIA